MSLFDRKNGKISQYQLFSIGQIVIFNCGISIVSQVHNLCIPSMNKHQPILYLSSYSFNHIKPSGDLQMIYLATPLSTLTPGFRITNLRLRLLLGAVLPPTERGRHFHLRRPFVYLMGTIQLQLPDWSF